MKSKASATADHPAPIARIAWLTSFVAPLVLLAVLAATNSAHAVTVTGGPAPVIDTAIVAGPGEGATIDDESPTFSFDATRDGNAFPGAAFHCKVDDEPATICTAPIQLDSLDDGAHTFSVFAEDPETSAFDPTPANRTFALDTGESGGGECEEAEEDEEEEWEEECEEETSPFPPDECLLRTARARVFAYTSNDKVRLVIRYTSLSPAEVSVGYWLKGKKGPLTLGEAKQRFAKKGLFRLTEKLSQAEMDKVRAAKGFMVDMDIPGTPRYCHRYYGRHLTIKRTLHSQVVWFQSDSIFGTAN